MFAIRTILNSKTLSTTLEDLHHALKAVEKEHKLEKYPGLLGQYPSSVFSNDSLFYQVSTPSSLFSVSDIHPIDSRSVISDPADPIDVLKNPFNPIENPSARGIPSYVPGHTPKKTTSDKIMEWLHALVVSNASVSNLLSLDNLDVLVAPAEQGGVQWEDEISSWNLNVVEAQPKGMWLANEHSYDQEFGEGGSWEGYGYRSNDEGYESLGERKKGRKVLRKKNPDEEVRKEGQTRNVLKKRDRWRQG